MTVKKSTTYQKLREASDEYAKVDPSFSEITRTEARELLVDLYAAHAWDNRYNRLNGDVGKTLDRLSAKGSRRASRVLRIAETKVPHRSARAVVGAVRRFDLAPAGLLARAGFREEVEQ